MAKYFLTLVLLTCLALQNNNVCSRAHPSESIDVHQMRQHQQYQQLQHAQHAQPRHAQLQQTPQQQQRHETHARQQRSTLKETKSNEEEDANALRRYYARLKRHMEHQREREEAQERSYNHVYVAAPQLRTMPRIWQHLLNANYDELGAIPESDGEEELSDEYVAPDSGMDNRMYGDAPALADVPTPLAAAEAAAAEVDAIDAVVSADKKIVDIEDNSISHELPEAVEDDETSVVNHDKPVAAVSTGCPKCEHNNRAAVEHVSEEELTRLRIEYVKQQILEKLRLKEPPNVSAVGLPKPIYEGVTIDQSDDTDKSKDLDDYYARTSKKFIFLKREKRECQRLGVHPSICFSFKIDDADADGFDVSTAVLWLFKNKQNRTKHSNDTTMPHVQQTIVVSEVQQQMDKKYLPLSKTIAIQSIDVQDEWMKIDIEWPIKRWFGNHDLSHLIQISCESCDIKSMDEMISVDKDYRPFIMIDTQNRRRQPRQKRSINCADGVTECCREKLYISFDEIGWGDWIIRPRGYDAYFCRGSCSSVASVAQSSSHHSTFLSKVLSTHQGGKKPLELVPCCTAKQYSSLQLVFFDSNNTATQKTFPNMVVESCGCR